MKQIEFVDVPKGKGGYKPPRKVVIQKPDPQWIGMQLDRLLHLPMSRMLQAEQGKAALQELVKTFHDRAESKAHVLEVVEELSRGERFPSKLDILNACGTLAKAEWRADPECEQCHGSGFRSVDIERNGAIYPTCAPCDCMGYFERQGA